MTYFEDFGPDFGFFYGSTVHSGNLPGMHVHPQYEVLIVTRGVAQTTYTNGIECPTTTDPSLTIFAPFTMHKTNFDRENRTKRFVFYFGNDMIREFSSFFEKFNTIFQNSIVRFPLSATLLEKILPHLLLANEHQSDTMFMKLNFLTLFYLVLSEGTPDLTMESSQNQNTIGKIIEYMLEHSRENLTAEKVANHFFISRSKLNQDFKTHLKVGFHALLMEMKLNQAYILLSESSKNINTIATELGFQKENYFNTFFKRMTGITPLQYRKKKLNKTSTSNPNPRD